MGLKPLVSLPFVLRDSEGLATWGSTCNQGDMASGRARYQGTPEAVRGRGLPYQGSRGSRSQLSTCSPILRLIIVSSVEVSSPAGLHVEACRLRGQRPPSGSRAAAASTRAWRSSEAKSGKSWLTSSIIMLGGVAASGWRRPGGGVGHRRDLADQGGSAEGLHRLGVDRAERVVRHRSAGCGFRPAGPYAAPHRGHADAQARCRGGGGYAGELLTDGPAEDDPVVVVRRPAAQDQRPPPPGRASSRCR